MSSSVTIRVARVEDAVELLKIYGYYVEDIGKELKKLKDIGNVSYVYTTEMI